MKILRRRFAFKLACPRIYCYLSMRVSWIGDDFSSEPHRSVLLYQLIKMPFGGFIPTGMVLEEINVRLHNYINILRIKCLNCMLIGFIIYYNQDNHPVLTWFVYLLKATLCWSYFGFVRILKIILILGTNIRHSPNCSALPSKCQKV